MTNAEMAILSLIAETPSHGYQIEQTIEQRGMRQWTEISFSSIYYLLKKLESKGWVTSRLHKAVDGPARKIYKITPEGQQALAAAALDTLRVPTPAPRPLLLGFSVLPMLNAHVVFDQLEQYLASLQAQRDDLTARRDAQQPLLPHVHWMFDYSLKMIEAEIEWFENLIQAYDKAYPKTPAGETGPSSIDQE
jgi:DNA-binding PadR family transcriptional regulator